MQGTTRNPVRELPSNNVRGVAQPGRAPGSGPGGRRFESSLPDHSFQSYTFQVEVQTPPGAPQRAPIRTADSAHFRALEGRVCAWLSVRQTPLQRYGKQRLATACEGGSLFQSTLPAWEATTQCRLNISLWSFHPRCPARAVVSAD